MIRLTALLKRNPDLSHDEFVDHWANQHGPLIRDNPALARHFVRYEQHPLAEDQSFAVGGYDGMAIQWFHSMDDMVAFVSEPSYAESVMPDERRFLDLDGIAVTFTTDPVVMIDDA